MNGHAVGPRVKKSVRDTRRNMEQNKVQLFEDQPIRTAWDEDSEEWYFAIVDVISVLTESKDAAAYWRKLKQRLKEEGNESVTNCHALKMLSKDGKRRKTDVASTEQLLRIIQSIPSKKAEPFKVWLAQVGYERIEETIDPELSIERALETYARLGYPEDWINQRLQTIRARKDIEERTGRPVITSQNAKQLNGVVTELIEGVSGIDEN